MAEEAAAAVDKPATTESDSPASSGRALVRYNSSVQNLAEGLWNRLVRLHERLRQKHGLLQHYRVLLIAHCRRSRHQNLRQWVQMFNTDSAPFPIL